jgi:hypothetical protein
MECNMWNVILVCGLVWAEPSSEDTAVEDTAVEDTAVEDTAVEDSGIEDTSTLDDDTATDTGSDTATDTSSDTGDTSQTDTSDTSDLVTPASSLAGEKGGYGCATVGVGGAIAIWIASFAVGFRREQEDV